MSGKMFEDGVGGLFKLRNSFNIFSFLFSQPLAKFFYGLIFENFCLFLH